MKSPVTLQRFLDAQASVYEDVLAELAGGQKRSHWMWFVFPQFRGLGQSEMAREYAIQSAAEATAYLYHPVLGARLRECTALVLRIDNRSIQHIFGFPDYLKFRSCMTLFASVAMDESLFSDSLAKFFGGEQCRLTLDGLRR